MNHLHQPQERPIPPRVSASTAISLIERYSRLTKAIAACRKRIGKHLDLCDGLGGFRREVEQHDGFDGGPDVGQIDSYETPTQRAQNDQETHLKGWYDGTNRDYDYDGNRLPIEAHKDDCPHCWAAHLVVEERKVLRRQLGAVKSSMTRLGS